MSAIVRPVVLWLSVLACLALLIAQVGAYLEFSMVPEPTASTTGPQNTADLVFGLMAIGLSGPVVVAALAVSAFILLGLPKNPYHTFTVLLLVPLTTLAFYLRPRQTGSYLALGSPTRS
jgi:FtsH-binding integral membrane protein